MLGGGIEDWDDDGGFENLFLRGFMGHQSSFCFRITRGFALFQRLQKAPITIQECDYHSHNTYESSKRPMKTLKYAKTLSKSLNRSLKK